MKLHSQHSFDRIHMIDGKPIDASTWTMVVHFRGTKIVQLHCACNYDTKQTYCDLLWQKEELAYESVALKDKISLARCS